MDIALWGTKRECKRIQCSGPKEKHCQVILFSCSKTSAGIVGSKRWHLVPFLDWLWIHFCLEEVDSHFVRLWGWKIWSLSLDHLDEWIKAPRRLWRNGLSKGWCFRHLESTGMVVSHSLQGFTYIYHIRCNMIYQLVLAGFLFTDSMVVAMCWIFQALLEYLEKMASKFDEGDIQCPQVAVENEFFASQHNWPHCTRHSEIVGLPYSKGRQLQKICTNHWLYFGILFDILLLNDFWGNLPPCYGRYCTLESATKFPESAATWWTEETGCFFGSELPRQNSENGGNYLLPVLQIVRIHSSYFFSKIFIILIWTLSGFMGLSTLPETNSSHMFTPENRRGPKRKWHLPTIHFQG